MRHLLLELGAALQQLFTTLVDLVDHLVWKIGHEWSNSSFFLLLALALGAAWWSLRSHYLGRHGR